MMFSEVAHSNDSTAKQRLKLHMKLLEAGGSTAPLQENRPTFKEKFVPPEVSMLSYFMAKVGNALISYCMFTVNLYYYSSEICLSVGASKLQVAIIARSSRETSQTVRID